jgi:hypoxanthine phosphoribosyltransferase
MESKNLQPLISKEKIQARVQELAQQISKDYANKRFVMIAVLEGASIFMKDLKEAMGNEKVVTDTIKVSSYTHTKSSGRIQMSYDLSRVIEGEDVLLVEDIVESGTTINWLLNHFEPKSPRSIKVCSLLYKKIDPTLEKKIHYLGFEVPDKFVVGYGLDYEGEYRDLPEISVYNGSLKKRGSL